MSYIIQIKTVITSERADYNLPQLSQTTNDSIKFSEYFNFGNEETEAALALYSLRQYNDKRSITPVDNIHQEQEGSLQKTALYVNCHSNKILLNHPPENADNQWTQCAEKIGVSKKRMRSEEESSEPSPKKSKRGHSRIKTVEDEKKIKKCSICRTEESKQWKLVNEPENTKCLKCYQRIMREKRKAGNSKLEVRAPQKPTLRPGAKCTVCGTTECAHWKNVTTQIKCSRCYQEIARNKKKLPKIN